MGELEELRKELAEEHHKVVMAAEVYLFDFFRSTQAHKFLCLLSRRE